LLFYSNNFCSMVAIKCMQRRRLLLEIYKDG
jgi:hypothetical protein